MIKLLFSSAGRRVELINCFKQAARELKVDLKVIAIDMDPSWSPACQVADYAYKVPRCTSPDFLGALGSGHAMWLTLHIKDQENSPFSALKPPF